MKKSFICQLLLFFLFLISCNSNEPSNSNEPIESIAFVGEYELTITEEGPYVKGTKTPLNDYDPIYNPVITRQWENKGWLRIVKEGEKLFIYTHVGGKMVEYDNPTGYNWAYQIEVEKITGNKLILKPTVESDMIPLTANDGTIIRYADRYFVYGSIEKEGDRIYWEMEWDDNLGANASSGADIQDYSIYLHIEGVIKQPENKEDEPSVLVLDNGALPGKFSVGSSKQVQFSQGNLQYQASTNTWRFAEHQYDIIAEDNTYINDSYNGWIDLFGWGTGNNPTDASINSEDYSTFLDWGINKISNGGNISNAWATLTDSEWQYLFYERTNADKLFGFGMVDDIKGIIILPDDYPNTNGIIFKPTTLAWDGRSYCSTVSAYWDGNSYQPITITDNFDRNVYTTDEWSKLEIAGAVFLPMGGYRMGNLYNYIEGNHGFYWSAKPKDIKNAYSLFQSSYLCPQASTYRYFGSSVRLVR